MNIIEMITFLRADYIKGYGKEPTHLIISNDYIRELKDFLKVSTVTSDHVFGLSIIESVKECVAVGVLEVFPLDCYCI